jgi:membrane protein YqaA with SNARE-associated domain
VSLPQINDILVVLMVTQNKRLMPYYAAMATLGSVAGCYVIYYLANKGGEAFLNKRMKADHTQRVLAMYRRHGLLALMVPALLPPPAPFKLFRAHGGCREGPSPRLRQCDAIARGVRYLVLGFLAIRYGDAALDLMRTHGPQVGLALAMLIVLAALVWWRVQRRLA